MKRIMGMGLILACLCFRGTCDAYYTEQLVGKYYKTNVKIEYLLTLAEDSSSPFGKMMDNNNSGWVGSKDPSMRESTARRQRPSIGDNNGSNDEVNHDENIEQIASGLNMLSTPNPRYIKKRYILTQYNGGISYKQDYPVYINDDYPELGVDFYIYEKDDTKLEELREKIRNAGAPKLPSSVSAYQAIGSYFAGSTPKESNNDLNIVQNSKFYFLDRVKKTGTWAGTGDIESSKELYNILMASNRVDSLGDFNVVKDILIVNRNLLDVKLLESIKVKIDTNVYVKEKIQVQKLSDYGRTIGGKLTVDLLYEDGELKYFTLPIYDNSDPIFEFRNYQTEYQYKNALFKVESISLVDDDKDFKEMDKYKLERLPLGW